MIEGSKILSPRHPHFIHTMLSKSYDMIEKNTCLFYNLNIMSMFGGVVAVTFQITFHAEMHVNDIFSFLKNYF